MSLSMFAMTGGVDEGDLDLAVFQFQILANSFTNYKLPVLILCQSWAGLGQFRPWPLTLTLQLSPQRREVMLQEEPLVEQVCWCVMAKASAEALQYWMPLPGIQDTTAVLVSQSSVAFRPLWGQGPRQRGKYKDRWLCGCTLRKIKICVFPAWILNGRSEIFFFTKKGLCG